MKHNSGLVSFMLAPGQVILCCNAVSCTCLPPPSPSVAVFIAVRALLTSLWRPAFVICKQAESVGLGCCHESERARMCQHDAVR